MSKPLNNIPFAFGLSCLITGFFLKIKYEDKQVGIILISVGISLLVLYDLLQGFYKKQKSNKIFTTVSITLKLIAISLFLFSDYQFGLGILILAFIYDFIRPIFLKDNLTNKKK